MIAIAIVALIATGCQKSPVAKQDLVSPAAPAQDLSQSLAIPPVQAPAPSQAVAPTTKEGWISLGNSQMDAGSYAEAIIAYQRALELDPSNVDVRVDMGTCYRNLGQAEKALEIYDKALQINPLHAYANRNRGVVLAFDLHRNAEAVAAFTKYLQIWPDAPDAASIRKTIAELGVTK